MTLPGLGDVDVDKDDVAEGWRTLTDAQGSAATTLIGRAAAILPTQSPGILDRLNAGTVAVEAVEQVIIQAVRRALAPVFNPEGASKVSRTGDDYSESFEWDTRTLLAGLFFTSRELASLSGPKPRRGKAFVINTTPRY